MQSATAAPATPVQIAASLSPILLICSVPPGQVAETRVSSGVQISWQRLSQATSRSARRPEGAADPDGPRRSGGSIRDPRRPPRPSDLLLRALGRPAGPSGRQGLVVQGDLLHPVDPEALQNIPPTRQRRQAQEQ
jgi:hypothetical protein